MDATTLLHLPVTDLAAHRTNLRDDLGDLDRLTASIRERGVIEPLVVVPLDTGGHRVLAGHRRLAAQAGLPAVPCWVRGDLAGDVDQVVTMIVENLHRADLTTAETSGIASDASFGRAREAIAGASCGPGRGGLVVGGVAVSWGSTTCVAVDTTMLG